MALTTKITAKLFGGIGLVGQSVGFVDFTPTQLASDGFIQTLNKTFEIDAKTLLVGIVSPTLGKEALMTQIEADVVLYLDTVFTDATKTYEGLIYVTNVVRKSDPIVGVSSADSLSVYVDRDDVFYVSVRMNVSVV